MRLIKLTEYPSRAEIFVVPCPGMVLRRQGDSTMIHLRAAPIWVLETPAEIATLLQPPQNEIHLPPLDD